MIKTSPQDVSRALLVRFLFTLSSLLLDLRASVNVHARSLMEHLYQKIVNQKRNIYPWLEIQQFRLNLLPRVRSLQSANPVSSETTGSRRREPSTG